MKLARLKLPIVLVLILLAAAAVASALWKTPEPAERTRVGVMTSLPIYWPDGADFSDMVAGNSNDPWVRQALETMHELVPLDTLAPGQGLVGEDEVDPLNGIDRLLIVQPRGLSPADNVTLDEWVREGGRLLLVLDPMLTGHYAGSIGDPRRPVATALIPPVVARWGLEVSFDDQQDMEPEEVETSFGSLPVILGGQVGLLGDAAPDCMIEGEGVIAICRVGQGRVTLVADATLFELEHGGSEPSGILFALVGEAFE